MDRPINGPPVKLVQYKHQFFFGGALYSMWSCTEQNTRIAFARHLTINRAGRWLTKQIGRHGRSVGEIVNELRCAWHSVNDCFPSLEEILIEHEQRCGDVTALGLDEVLFVHNDHYRRLVFSSSIVDVTRGPLLEAVPGRSVGAATSWLLARGGKWLGHVLREPRSLVSLPQHLYQDRAAD